jgi:hypothetical protein
MIAFEGLLIPHAEAAGMKVPPNPEEFDAAQYPHFRVFCNVQIGSPMPSPTAPSENARVIAKLTKAEVQTVTLERLVDLGLVV